MVISRPAQTWVALVEAFMKFVQSNRCSDAALTSAQTLTESMS